MATDVTPPDLCAQCLDTSLPGLCTCGAYRNLDLPVPDKPDFVSPALIEGAFPAFTEMPTFGTDDRVIYLGLIEQTGRNVVTFESGKAEMLAAYAPAMPDESTPAPITDDDFGGRSHV